MLLLSDEGIRYHIEEYQQSKKLKPENGGSSTKLQAEQLSKLLRHLELHTYLFAKDILPYIETEFGIQYTVPGITSLLKRHGFSYKKPALVPGKANRKQQEEWIHQYEVLKQQIAYDETICFLDGVHPTHNPQLCYGWIRKGVRKEIPANTGRGRLNLSGALDLIAGDILVQEDTTLNAASTLTFLRKIEEAYPTKRKIHLFCDNAPYYRNKAVKAYLEQSKIEMHFLPPYSPNLNPIERVWKWMKERVLYNTYYPEFEDFKKAIFGFFESLANANPSSRLKEIFRVRIKDNFRAIGLTT